MVFAIKGGFRRICEYCKLNIKISLYSLMVFFLLLFMIFFLNQRPYVNQTNSCVRLVTVALETTLYVMAQPCVWTPRTKINVVGILSCKNVSVH